MNAAASWQTPRMRRLHAAALTASALLLAGCTSAAAVPEARDQSTDVPFTGCDTVACTGEINGAAYEIVMPETWNGTLLLYSHGYRPAEPFPPNFSAVVTSATPVPGWDAGDKSLGQALLDRGFALAGSSYRSNGWAVEDGVIAGEELYAFFAEQIAEPRRVYVWGDSLGGLITQTLAERHPEWVDGAAPLCGVMAGLEPNIGLALDTAYGVQQLLYPGMQITDFASYQEALRNWEGASSRLIQGARDQDTDVIARIFTIAAMVDAPSQTFTYDGSSIVSSVSGTIESLLTALAYGTVGQEEIDRRFGGTVVSNVGTNYANRLDASERETIDAIGGEGAADRLVAILDNGPRIEADPAAQAAAIERGGDPSGAVQVPTITMHTKADPLVIAQNQSFFRDRYQEQVAQGNVRGGLLQLFTVAPPEYPQQTGAPYGAGHCNFTPESRIAVIELLDEWVRNGVYPGQAAVEAAMGPRSGYSATYTPGPWPDAVAVATE
jgi:pimeloyl-ACP methyl ester carboxylesterase